MSSDLWRHGGVPAVRRRSLDGVSGHPVSSSAVDGNVRIEEDTSNRLPLRETYEAFIVPHGTACPGKPYGACVGEKYVSWTGP